VAGKKPPLASVAPEKSRSENFADIQVSARNDTETDKKSTQPLIAIEKAKSDTRMLGRQQQSHKQTGNYSSPTYSVILNNLFHSKKMIYSML
jgi:hypothetical protein